MGAACARCFSATGCGEGVPVDVAMRELIGDKPRNVEACLAGDIANPNFRLKPGMYARVQLTVATDIGVATDVPADPERAAGHRGVEGGRAP